MAKKAQVKMKIVSTAFLWFSFVPGICDLWGTWSTDFGLIICLCGLVLSPFLAAIGFFLSLSVGKQYSRTFWMGTAISAAPGIVLAIVCSGMEFGNLYSHPSPRGW